MKYPWVTEGVQCVCIQPNWSDNTNIPVSVDSPKFMQTYTIKRVQLHFFLWGGIGIQLDGVADIVEVPMGTVYVWFALEDNTGAPNFAPIIPIEAKETKKVEEPV